MGGNHSSVSKEPNTKSSDHDVQCKDKEKSLSVFVSEFLSTFMQRPPFKLRLIELYHGLYNKLFGPWGRIVGSYADCMSISTSDVDFMLDTIEVLSSSSINQSRPSSAEISQSTSGDITRSRLSSFHENQLNSPLFDDDHLEVCSPNVGKSFVNQSELRLSYINQSGSPVVIKQQESSPLGSQSELQNSDYSQWKKAFVIFTEDEEIPPGCCWLLAYEMDEGQFVPLKSDKWKFLLIDGVFHKLVENEVALVDRKGFKCLSSRDYLKFKDNSGLTAYTWFNRFLPKWIPHGPAFKQTYFGLFDIDVIDGFTCKTLPNVLSRWAHRKRKNWPTAQVIQIALSQGCHVVALPSKVSADDLSELEWRFGYGKMEKVLIESLNTVQKQCFLLLKIILKEYIKPKFPDDDILSSFMMKMLIFWMAEETDDDVWTPSNLLYCLNKCMERLNEWIQSEYFPNFFLPEYNLFRTKVERMRKVDFATWFRACVELEWRVLLECKTTKRIIQQHS